MRPHRRGAMGPSTLEMLVMLRLFNNKDLWDEETVETAMKDERRAAPANKFDNPTQCRHHSCTEQ